MESSSGLERGDGSDRLGYRACLSLLALAKVNLCSIQVGAFIGMTNGGVLAQAPQMEYGASQGMVLR